MRNVNHTHHDATPTMADQPQRADTSPTEVLRVEDLSYRYARQEVFNSVQFLLKAGDIAFLTGCNGAGKSTMLRTLAGWDLAYKGRIWLCGQPFTPQNRKQQARMSFVGDTPAFYDDLTAAEHLDLVLKANRASYAKKDASYLMEVMGLSKHGNQVPSAYSRGMRQKLALVLALLMKPSLLLLDEPYGPLDPSSAEVLSGLLCEACAQGTATLMSCHHEIPKLKPSLLLNLEDGHINTTLPED